MTQITLVQGDITAQHVDVVVNAANSSLLGGGGVDGAIHRAGGPRILAECRALRASHYGGGLKEGQAVATTAGDLPAEHVVHTVGPVYRDESVERGTELLASCYRQSLRLAVELGARSVAFPAISTGVFGWPMESAARIALSTVRAELAAAGSGGGADGGLVEVRFVLFGSEAYGVFEGVWRELAEGGPAAD
ncbi:O-acetyl-ADP-ribose deacetylase [Kitasatospora viridis]|uniref:O-acetyl-ADP-ribose deacetylase (Regulator of RNase III) n=1 Tax=Kitasatospora viridis TaxID=281105 RepID=A0A561UIL5_9ACTN|nr:O-acetyl-ADP-ribose deacetylase [Kitasatospora viridis]TWF99218.1 O-acetyl-ADP-ribose deacetylase (regulator of RNase III) [Kitasatospora viridis]